MTYPVPSPTYLAPPDQVAPALLGKLLVRRLEAVTLIGRIVETEAYFGLDDPAAHSFAGRTARTQVLFGPPGHAYVYLIYGMYSCLNVTCEPEGQAGCVLIRALEPIAGLEEMARNRRLPVATKPARLTAGPGRLCQAFAITRAEHYAMDLTSPDSNLQIQEDGFRAGQIAITPRINISKAADRLLRYTLAGHACVSKGRFFNPEV
jgi:DNA-3-methyladenine glycosylase